MTKASDNAYPLTYEEMWGGEDQFTRQAVEYGLTKREYFAAMAMQGMCAHMGRGSWNGKDIARWSVEIANEVITELNKQQP